MILVFYDPSDVTARCEILNAFSISPSTTICLMLRSHAPPVSARSYVRHSTSRLDLGNRRIRTYRIRTQLPNRLDPTPRLRASTNGSTLPYGNGQSLTDDVIQVHKSESMELESRSLVEWTDVCRQVRTDLRSALKG